MGKGILVGLVLGAVVFAAFIGWEGTTGKRIFGSKPVEELVREAPDSLKDLARTNPTAALPEIKKVENYPAFIAFLDMDVNVTQRAVDDYKQIYDQVKAYYSGNTDGQIVQSVFRIYEGQEYWPGITYRNCLEYLQQTLPPGGDLSDSERASQVASGGYRTNVRGAADDIYDWMVYEYMRPQLEAAEQQRQYRQQLQQNINQNLQRMKAEGQAYNQAKRAQEAAAQRREDRIINNIRRYDHTYGNSRWNWRR